MARRALATLIALAGIVWLGTSQSLAQTAPAPAPEAKTRPRIGLVLSGGGARGIAHIGVLRVLEERRVPVDLITGTSMGSIIGGLYAAGYSPDQMEEIVDGIDWADAFDDAPPRSQRSFRRKVDDYNFLTSLKLGVKKSGIALPWGLVQGQKLNLILRRLFLPVAQIHDFDQLHVPFRAVSTNVINGEAVVHASGDLATAVRASMSLPGVFAPVELEDKLLVDGGISNNTPVDLAIQMGADVLIVVDVGTPLAGRDKITNAAAVVSQLTSLMVVSTTQRELALMRPQDILIRPDLEGVSTASFEMGSSVAPRGEEAARAQLAALDRLGVPADEHARWLALQRQGPTVLPRVATVNVENDSRLDSQVLEARLETQAGEPLDVARLESDLQQIYGIDAFERVDYRLDEGPAGTDPEIQAKEKSWGPAYLRFGLNLEENFESTSDYNLAFNLTVRPIDRLGGEWRNDLIVGSTVSLYTELWQPFDAESRWFAAPSFLFRRERLPIYDGDDHTGDYLVRQANFGLDLGRQLSNWGELRLGVAYDFGHSRTIVGTPDRAESFRAGGAFARFVVDTLDGVHFPRDGTFVRASYGIVRKSLGAEDSYDILYGQAARALTYRDNTLLLSLAGQSTWNASRSTGNLALLGGFLQLSGLDHFQLAGQNSAFGRIMAYRRVAMPGALSFQYPIYAGLSAEGGNVSRNRDDLFDNFIAAGAAWVGMETPLGPIYFGYGYAEGGRDSFYLYLGPTF